jgi:anti-sigma factor RsiW
MKEHLNKDQLLDRLYGIADGQDLRLWDLHLEDCAECAQRLSEMREMQAALAANPDVSSDFLAAQRRKIYARMGEQPRANRAWAPALAAACLLAIGIVIYRPAAPLHTDSQDAQLFAEVYSMEQSTEPRAAEPIHALFEENR